MSSAYPPADGERRAARGLGAQYRVAAELIYQALVDEDLDWIALADPEAGRLDDIQIARPGRLDAYQVKWHSFNERMTFNELVTKGDKGKPCLWRQLADGWTALGKRHPDRRIHAHLLTNASASTGDKVTEFGTGPRHFQAFLREEFAQRHTREQPVSSPEPWADALEILQMEGGLGAQSYRDFLSCCHLDLDFRLQGATSAGHSLRHQADLQSLATFLFDAVASHQKRLHFTRTDLLQGLGWRDRLDLRFRHDFPVDERTYRPVASTIEEIDQALQRFSRGYLALIGPPGAGKSTTLTQTLRYRPGYRVVRYYAFVRDDPAQGRGEAEAFLSDVTLALRRLGVRPGKRRPGSTPLTRYDLQAELGSLFADLHEDWKTSGIKTLILVDGLDHITREQRPSTPLFDVLPSPDELPDGVIVIVGTQPPGLAALPDGIQSQLDEAGRTMTMARLSRPDMYAITVATVDPTELSDSRFERICELSGGHPLALTYLLNRLKQAKDGKAFDGILEASDPTSADVEQDYGAFWRQLRTDRDVRDLLGLVCRLRGAIDLTILMALSPLGALDRFVAEAGHYFRPESADRWTFFHNSFRQFLISATTTDPLGRHDPAADQTFHHRLADAIGALPSDHPVGWERLHHLGQAGDSKAILASFSQARFRGQFMAQRPLENILDDLALCLRASVAEDDRVAGFRVLLIELELRERSDSLRDVDLPDLQLALADPAHRSDIAFQDGALRISDKVALDHAANWQRDDPSLARRLFEAAEPLGLISGSRPVAPGRDKTEIDAWVRVAWRFHPLEKLLELIEQVQPEPADGDSLEFARRAFTLHLLHTLGLALLAAQEWGRLAEVRRRLAELDTPGASDALLVLDFQLATAGAREAAAEAEGRGAYERISDRLPPSKCDPQAAVAIADLHVRWQADEAIIRSYLEAAPESQAVDHLDLDRGPKDLREVTPLIRQVRVRARLGDTPSPVEMVMDAGKQRSRGSLLLQRALVTIAALHGEADRGVRLTPEVVVRRLSSGLLLFARNWRETREWLDWHTVRGRAPAFFRLLLGAAFAHGRESLTAVFDALVQRWRMAHPEAGHWPLDWKLATVTAAFELDGDTARTVRWLDELEREITVAVELEDRVAYRRDLLRAWLLLGDIDRARSQFAALMDTSFGIYHSEDDQLARWSEYALTAASLLSAGPDLAPLIKAIANSHRLDRGDDIDKAAAATLTAAGHLSPGYVATLATWWDRFDAISRAARLAGLLRAGLSTATKTADAASLITVIARLFAPFASQSALEIPEAVRQLAKGPLGEAEAVRHALRQLDLVIDTKVDRFSRWEWRNGLKPNGKEEIGEPGSGQKRGVWLKGQRFVPEAKLLDRSVSLVEIEPRLERLGDLDLEKVLDALPANTSLAALHRLYARMSELRAPITVNVWFAGRFASLGDAIGAGRSIDRAVAESKPHGWDKRYDGGTRLLAARALVAAKGEAGRREAYALFVSDYLDLHRYPRDLLRSSLRALLDTFFEEIPIQPLWTEIAEHVGMLAEARLGELAPPPVVDQDTAPFVGSLADIAREEMLSPISAIADEARRCLRDMLEVGPLTAVTIGLRSDLRASGDFRQLNALLTLGSVRRPGAICPTLLEAVRPLATSPSIMVRREARKLLVAAGETLSPIPTTPLPATYELHLPPTAMKDASASPEIVRGQPLTDTDDTIELSRPFHKALEMLADASGFTFEVLARRMRNLMAAAAPRETWSNSAERNFQSRQEARGLKMTYRRPRVTVGQLALSRLFAELEDAGAISNEFAEVDPWLWIVDPGLLSVEPAPRPIWLSEPDAKTFDGRGRDDWTQRGEEATGRAPFELQDGSLVVAERTRLMRTDRSKPTEVRASRVAPRGGTSVGEKPESGFFIRHPRWTAAAYPHLHDIQRVGLELVIEGGWRFTDPFLAFNPTVAQALGWRSDSGALFGWTDESGATMAHSIFWRDGDMENAANRGYENLSSEGWAVILSSSGRRQIAAGLSHCERVFAVARSIDENDGFPEEVFSLWRQDVAAGSPITPI